MVVYELYEFLKNKEMKHKRINMIEIDRIKSLNHNEVYEGIEEFFEYWNRK